MTIQEILDELRIPTAPTGHHHVSSEWVGIDCPFCSPNAGRFRMGIPVDTKGTVSCWTCGVHGLWNSLQNASGRPFEEVKALCGGLAPDRAVERTPGPLKRLLVPPTPAKLLKPHRKYLESRNFDPDELQELWGIQGYGIHSRFPWRLFIPIRLGEETVSWTTRSIADHGSRYTTAKPNEEKISSRKVLYGAELARHGVVVVEGPTDAWSIGPGTVATLGVGFSQAQVALLSAYPIRAVCFDNDRDAQKRAKQLIRLLQVFDGETFNVVLDHKDANRAIATRKGRRDVRELRKRFLS